MLNTRNILIAAFITAPFILGIGGFLYNNVYENENRQPRMYRYQTRYGLVDPALYTDPGYQTDSLIAYYRKVENGANDNPVFDFPPLTFPADTCVYVMGYNADSTIADVICYASCETSRKQGYIYARTLHSKPLSDEMLEDWKKGCM